jgi:putative sigma-54 modulation protein
VDIEITGKHIEVTEPMERHIRQRIEKLPRWAEIVQYFTVTLRKDSGNLLAEIIAKCPRADLVVEATSHDMYQSIDEAFSKMEHRLTRYHDKLVSGRAREAQRASEVDKQPD